MASTREFGFKDRNFGNGQGLGEVEVPSRFHDRHLDKFAAYLQEHYHDILIVVPTMDPALSL